MSVLRPTLAALKMLVVLTAIFGVLYPAVITCAAQLFPERANGSPIMIQGTVRGSALLGQQVNNRSFFKGRPSVSDSSGAISGGSNLGPGDPRLAKAVRERASSLRADNPDADGPIPADALTASGSGLDPHISPAYAAWQIPRVAAATGMSRADLTALVSEHTQGPELGFIGAARVNVTELNIALALRMNQ